MKIAIQSSGRLRPDSLNYLQKFGIKISPSGRELITTCPNTKVEILSVRDDDIPQYITQGVADFGIVGRNILAEQQSKLNIIEELNFCRCDLVIAVPNNSPITKITDLQNERIATTYPNLLAEFLQKNQIKASIIPIKGSVEITPKLNLADAICDLTQTGKTLKENDLRILTKVCESEAVLISSTQKEMPPLT